MSLLRIQSDSFEGIVRRIESPDILESGISVYSSSNAQETSDGVFGAKDISCFVE
jgi:hypothetical protein